MKETAAAGRGEGKVHGIEGKSIEELRGAESQRSMRYASKGE